MSDAAPASETILTDTAPAAAPASAPAEAPAPAVSADTLLTTDPTTTEAPKTEGTEAKADDAKTDEVKAGAPEAYEDFKLPEKFEASESALSEFKTLAKDLNLTQEQAQKLVDFQTTQTKGNTQALVQNLMEGVDKTAKEWADSAKADAEYGGEKYNENLGLAKSALKAFGTDDLTAILNQSRMGNHPEVVRFMVRVGKAISQDGFIPGRAGNPAPKDAASALYPNSQG